MRRRPSARWALILVAAAACSGTETGNPPFTASAGFDGYEPVGIAPDPQVERGFLVVGRVAFVPAGECGAGEPAPSAEGPFAVSLTGEAGDAVTAQIGIGEYCGLDVALAAGTPTPPADAPAELARAAVVIEAITSDGTPVRVVSTADPTLRLRGDPAFAMGPEEAPVLLAVDWTLLFAGVGLSTAEVTDGVIVLDATHNPSLLGTLEANLPTAVRLFRDLDADGTLSVEESREAPLASVP